MPADTVVLHSTYGPALPDLNWVPAPRFLLRRDRVRRHMNGVEPSKILDIGCGPATLLAEFSQRGFDCTGVDRSAQAREVAGHLRQIAPNLALAAELDPAWQGTFDTMFSFEVIEHLEDDISAMADWRPYLKPGGRMLLSTPAHPSRWNAADEWAGHVRRYERKGLVASVEAAGYKVEHVECYGFPLANIMEVWRARAYAAQLQKAEKSDKSADTLTDESGSDRTVESRMWKTFSGTLPTLAMRTAFQLQRPFLQTDFGNGFLVIARAD